MTLIQLPIGFFLSTNNWIPVSFSMWPWLITIGITALTGHYCMTRALAIADATVVVPLDFLRLPLIAVIGYLFYNETLEKFIFIEAFIMLFGNFINISAEHKKQSLHNSH